ncbi:MAG: NUDIX domain-containing protein, partial [Rudaea sp.]
IEETLEREVLEETGWSLRDARLLGLLHYHHLEPRPPAYRYPYPDFIQLVFVAEASRFFGVSRVDPEVLTSDFYPVDEMERLGLPATQLALFHAALEERSR